MLEVPWEKHLPCTRQYLKCFAYTNSCNAMTFLWCGIAVLHTTNSRYYYYPVFSEMEAEAQGSSMTYWGHRANKFRARIQPEPARVYTLNHSWSASYSCKREEETERMVSTSAPRWQGALRESSSSLFSLNGRRGAGPRLKVGETSKKARSFSSNKKVFHSLRK